MEIIFRREQTRRTFGPIIDFKLFAMINFDDEESALVKRYRFDEAELIEVPQPGLLRQAVVLGLIVFLLVYSFFFFGLHYQMEIYYRVSMGLNLFFSATTAIGLGMIFYHQKRETIYVKDLIHGRHFKCRSVVALARKEAFLHHICGQLRQVMESAKNWDGNEIHEVLPLSPGEAKRAIMSGPVF